MASDAFADAWVQANRTAHAELVKALVGEAEARSRSRTTAWTAAGATRSGTWPEDRTVGGHDPVLLRPRSAAATSRSPAGSRRDNLDELDALARLDLVGTLRELGVDLTHHRAGAGPRALAARGRCRPCPGAGHPARYLAAAPSRPGRGGQARVQSQELELLHELVKLSDAERRRSIHQFIDEAFGGLDAHPDLVAMVRSAMPERSDDPTPPRSTPGSSWPNGSRPGLQGGRAAEHQAAERADGDQSGLHHN